MTNETNLEEIWVDIIGYEGYYQLSNTGKVKSLARATNNQFCKEDRLLKLSKNKDGYLKVELNKNGEAKKYQVHRLVALHFIPNPNDLPMINHKNEVRDDNRVENLEWCDAKYNANYGTRNEKLSKLFTGRENTWTKEKLSGIPRSQELKDHLSKLFKGRPCFPKVLESCSKPIAQIDKDTLEVIQIFPSASEAARQLNFSKGNIANCASGKSKYKTSYGYIWEYIKKEKEE